MNRLDRRFQALRHAGRAGLVVYVMAGDPNHESALALLESLPAAGADVIELGMPFSDPAADGPLIQAAAHRSLKAGGSLRRTLETLRAFRARDAVTPVVLMGYYNPIYVFGPDRFAAEAAQAGADGVIVVDLPPEEAAELAPHLQRQGVHPIFLATPTTADDRLPTILESASGFLYYVSVAGVTGTTAADAQAAATALKRLRARTDLPIAVGFGVKTPEAAAAIAATADAVVVGSAVVGRLASGAGDAETLDNVRRFVASLAHAVRAAREQPSREGFHELAD